MLTQNDLTKYHTGLEITDLFGKGRMTELLYDLKLRISKDEEEIELWKSAYLEQGKAVKGLVDMRMEPERALQEENARLKKELQKAQESVEALQLYAESLEKKVVTGKKIYTNEAHWIKEESA